MTAERVKSGLERAKAQGNVRQAPIDWRSKKPPEEGGTDYVSD